MPVISVSITDEQEKFIKDNQYSPSRIFQWALEQKGFKNPNNPKKKRRKIKK